MDKKTPSSGKNEGAQMLTVLCLLLCVVWLGVKNGVREVKATVGFGEIVGLQWLWVLVLGVRR